jgi:hypothetical protein
VQIAWHKDLPGSFATTFLMTTGMERNIMSLYEETVNSLLAAAGAFSRETFNQIPFGGSWTAAQVLVHITKSNLSVAEVLSWQGKPVHRPPDKRVKELGDIFLDFTTRLKSPDFILPEPGVYEKAILAQNLQHSITRIYNEAAGADLSEAVKHPVFGDITRLELLYFVTYHTRRHINQLNNILKYVSTC